LREFLGDEYETVRCGRPASAPIVKSGTPPLMTHACMHRGDDLTSVQRNAHAGMKKDAPKLLLAHKWEPSVDPTGWWLSEKLVRLSSSASVTACALADLGWRTGRRARVLERPDLHLATRQCLLPARYATVVVVSPHDGLSSASSLSHTHADWFVEGLPPNMPLDGVRSPRVLYLTHFA
jgi:hypothetical protein